MGLLGKVFGLEKKGTISLTVDKPSYIAGELVVGTINVTVLEPIECNAVVLKATGKERVRWSDDTKSSLGYMDEKEFFKEKIVISSIPNTYMPGNYTYPFEYQLPPDLPGSIEIDHFPNGGVVYNVNCRITYKLKATLDINGFFAKDLKENCYLTVHQQLSHTVHPSREAISQPVKFLCCFSKGTCHLDVAMDKNAYMAGETAQIFCRIQNESQVDIPNIRCKLIQELELNGCGCHEVLSRELCSQTFPGVRASERLEQPQLMPLVLPEGRTISPSTMGRLLKSSYYMEIECDIPWCPDVRLALPLTVIAPIVVMLPAAPVPI